MKKTTLGLLLAVILAASGAFGATPPEPNAGVPVIVMPWVDVAKAKAEDPARISAGLPPRFAIPIAVDISPKTDGLWDTDARGNARWRLKLSSPGALTINLGFTEFWMPSGGHLLLSSGDGKYTVRPFTSEDNRSYQELWTPVVPGDSVVLEVTVPTAVKSDLKLHLTQLGHDYRGFGQPSLEKSGACNVDVICPEGNNYRDIIRSVAVISTGGSTFCTGSMLNDAAGDLKPYFMTANHCGINTGNAASLVTYWNFENSTCRPIGSPASGGPGDGTLTQFATGSTFRAASAPSDFTLVELSATQVQLQPFNIFWAGWDRSPGDFACSAPTPCAAIHHPNTDEKRITFSTTPTTTTSYNNPAVPGDGTHVHATWSLGVTEPGSSGSPLYSPAKRFIGQLHGGPSACGAGDLSDYYGHFSVSWTGGGTAATRAQDWLDPSNTVMFVDGRNQCTAPAVASGVVAVANGANHIDVTWSAAAGAATYDVQRGDGACPSGSFVTIATGVAGTTYPDTAVSGGSTYAYRVVSVGADACKAGPSSCADAVASGACTLAPTFAGLASATNAASASCQIALAWNAGTARCGASPAVYNVYRSTTNGFTPSAANRIASCVALNAYTDTSVVTGTRYYYVVRAEDDSGNGAGPCRSGNEDGNTVQKSAVPTGAPSVSFSDDMESGPANWTTMGTGTPWAIVTSQAHSPTHSFFVDDPASITDRSVRTASAVTVGAGSTLAFWHRYTTERGSSAYDGGVLEWSFDATNWFDILAGGGAVPANATRFTQGGYVAPLSSCCSNPLAGRQSWSGNNNAFENVVVDLADFSGQSVYFRWRLGTDSSVAATGWWVDDVTISQGSPCTTGAVSGFYTLAPCRVVDTRNADGPLGGPALAAGATRDFTLSGSCGIPADATVVSINVTVTSPTDAGYLTLYRAGDPVPATSSINFAPGQTRANNALSRLSGAGAISVIDGQPSGSVHFILDVNGYFR